MIQKNHIRNSPAARLPPSQPFRLQGFSPSWRISSRNALPVCFTRLTLMGFSLQSFPLGCSRTFFRRRRVLLTLQQPVRKLASTRLQDFAPHQSPLAARTRFRLQAQPRCSLGLFPLQGFRPSCLSAAFAASPLLFRGLEPKLLTQKSRD